MTRSATVLSAIVAICMSAGTAVIAHAQGYPDRPIKLVVPFPAGGAIDTTSRLVAQRLQAALGQSVIIENQGGAGGSIGARQVANAAPDGYTLLMGSVGPSARSRCCTSSTTIRTKPSRRSRRQPPTRSIMVAGPTLQVKTVQELVQLAKANPGKLNYGNAIGIGPKLVAEFSRSSRAPTSSIFPIAAARR